jgi:hypothetical protein
LSGPRQDLSAGAPRRPRAPATLSGKQFNQEADAVDNEQQISGFSPGEARLNKVIEGLDEALTFAPGESKQLTPPAEALPLSKKGEEIIQDAIRMGANMMGAIQDRIDFWTDKKQRMQAYVEEMIDNRKKLAAKYDNTTRADDRLADTFTRGIDEHKAANGEE